MKIEYDPKNDLLNIEFLPEVKIKESVELDGLVIDYSGDGKIVSIEILDAAKRISKDPLEKIDVSILRDSSALRV